LIYVFNTGIKNRQRNPAALREESQILIVDTIAGRVYLRGESHYCEKADNNAEDRNLGNNPLRDTIFHNNVLYTFSEIVNRLGTDQLNINHSIVFSALADSVQLSQY